MKTQFFENNRRKLMEQMQEGSVVLLFSGSAPRKSANEMYPYIPNSHFYYLTGIEEAECAFMIKKVNGQVEEQLFIPSYDELKAKWDGATVTKEMAQTISGVEHVRFMDGFKSSVQNILSQPQVERIGFDLIKQGVDEPLTYSHQMCHYYKNTHPHLHIENINHRLLTLRNIKQDEEVACMRQALDITNEGIKFLMKYANHGIYEYQLEAYFDFIVKTNGVVDYGFKSIAAAGKNATILHYQKNNCMIPEGSLILFDLGIKYKHYGVDISRTFPVNGKFTERQKLFYNIVLKAQTKVIDAIKPGIKFSRLNEMVRETYLEELGKLGMVSSDEELSKYYFHGVSHFLSSDAQVLVTPDYVLEAGMTLTVEPGLYIEEEAIGIRIEDDILVTEGGCEVLSKDIIKSVEEIENFML